MHVFPRTSWILLKIERTSLITHNTNGIIIISLRVNVYMFIDHLKNFASSGVSLSGLLYLSAIISLKQPTLSRDFMNQSQTIYASFQVKFIIIIRLI